MDRRPVVHDRPLCFGCVEVIEYDPVFAAPCGHARCPSASWHGLCLMEHREHQEKAIQAMRRWILGHTP